MARFENAHRSVGPVGPVRAAVFKVTVQVGTRRLALQLLKPRCLKNKHSTHTLGTEVGSLQIAAFTRTTWWWSAHAGARVLMTGHAITLRARDYVDSNNASCSEYPRTSHPTRPTDRAPSNCRCVARSCLPVPCLPHAHTPRCTTMCLAPRHRPYAKALWRLRRSAPKTHSVTQSGAIRQVSERAAARALCP